MAQHPEITIAFDGLADRLRDIVAGRPLLFITNPGNWGDSLIREGAEQFLTHYGFDFHVARFRDILKKRTTVSAESARTGHARPVMVYNGNGVLTARNAFRVHQIAELSRQFDTSIILPSTYPIALEPFEFSDSTHFFARDRFQSMRNNSRAVFCHDMAFFLSPRRVGSTRGTGWFMRDDIERPSGRPLHRLNVDLSREGYESTPVEPLFDLLAGVERVHTDRMHVAIAAGMMGCDVRLYASDYFKIEAIHRSSLAPYFPNVVFSEEATIPPRDRQRWYHRFVRRRAVSR